MNPDFGEQFHFVVKFSSAYILVFGVMLMLLYLDPIKNRILCIPVLGLFGIRLLNKIIFFNAIGSAFGIEPVRNMFAVGSLLVFFAGILLTMPKRSDIS